MIQTSLKVPEGTIAHMSQPPKSGAMIQTKTKKAEPKEEFNLSQPPKSGAMIQTKVNSKRVYVVESVSTP